MSEVPLLENTKTRRHEGPRSDFKRRLAVVIVNYRTAGMVRDCLGTLLPQLSERDVVVVVENGSGEGGKLREVVGGFERSVREHAQRGGDAQEEMGNILRPAGHGIRAGACVRVVEA